MLFAAPQADANRAPRLNVERAQNPHGLERNDGSGAVIGSSGARNPAIEMTSKHHHLILQRRVGACDLSNHIATRLMIAIKLRGNVKTHGDRNAVRNQTMHAAERLARNRRRRNSLLMLGPIHKPSQRSSRVIVQVTAEAAGSQNCDRMLVGKKVPDLLEKGHLFKYFFPQRRIVRKNKAVILVAIEGIGTEVVELGHVVMLERILRVGINFRRIPVKYDFARKLSLPRGEVFLLLKGRNRDHRTRSFAGRRG